MSEPVNVYKIMLRRTAAAKAIVDRAVADAQRAIEKERKATEPKRAMVR